MRFSQEHVASREKEISRLARLLTESENREKASQDKFKDLEADKKDLTELTRVLEADNKKLRERVNNE